MFGLKMAQRERETERVVYKYRTVGGFMLKPVLDRDCGARVPQCAHRLSYRLEVSLEPALDRDCGARVPQCAHRLSYRHVPPRSFMASRPAVAQLAATHLHSHIRLYGVMFGRTENSAVTDCAGCFHLVAMPTVLQLCLSR
jgi:hypothetical protein